MRRIVLSLFATLLLAPNLQSQYDGPASVPQAPLAHVATKAAYSAAVYVVLREGMGMQRLPAALLSTIGVVVVTKSIMYLQHPTWWRPWSPKDIGHDLMWHSLIVFPLAVGPRERPWRAGVSLGGLGAGILLTRSWAAPRW